MAYKERELINQVLIDGSKKGRIFRANAGKAWQGEKLKKSIPIHIFKMLSAWMRDNNIKHNSIKILINPRIFHGMPEGFPDTFGWESKILCEIIHKNNPDCKNDSDFDCVTCHLNKSIAIFKAVECKTGKQRLTKEQQRFKDMLEQQGGIYEIKTDEFG